MGNADIKQLLQEWHETKSIAVANDICQRLYDAVNWEAVNGR